MTNETTNGPPASSERLQKLDEELDQFEASLGLPTTVPAWLEPEARRLLDLSPDLLGRMTPVELGEGSYSLERFALSLQRASNREQARVTWANARLALVLAPSLARQVAYAWEERRLQAISGNKTALDLESIRVQAQLRLDRLAYVAAKVQNLSKYLAYLQQNKSRA